MTIQTNNDFSIQHKIVSVFDSHVVVGGEHAEADNGNVHERLRDAHGRLFDDGHFVFR